jgi:hypothetical protein
MNLTHGMQCAEEVNPKKSGAAEKFSTQGAAPKWSRETAFSSSKFYQQDNRKKERCSSDMRQSLRLHDAVAASREMISFIKLRCWLWGGFRLFFFFLFLEGILFLFVSGKNFA